jgi:Rod binding domain-containing protein
MNAILPTMTAANASLLSPVAQQPTINGNDRAEVKEAFDRFVGETFYGQMLKAMRKSVNKAGYFHGGRAEEIFQEQLDQTIAQSMAKSTADQFTGPMFELFSMQRK